MDKQNINNILFVRELLGKAFDKLFISNTLVLSEFEMFCDVVSKFGDLQLFDCNNLLLVYEQKPSATDLRTKEEWEMYGININADASSILVSTTNGDHKVVVKELFDIVDTTSESTSSNITYNPEELLLSLVAAFRASDIPVYTIDSELVDWKDWCKLQIFDLDECFLEIRNPSDEERNSLSNYEIYKCQFKSIIKTFSLYYFSIIEQDISDKNYPDELPQCDIDLLSNFVTDLVCRKYDIKIENDYSYMEFPPEFNGVLPKVVDFRGRIDQVLVFFRFIVNALNCWLGFIQNPSLALDVHKIDTQEEG